MKMTRVKRDRLLSVAEKLVIDSMTSTDNPGICLACETEHEGIEPDAEGYKCESCGEMEVMGCEQVIVCLC